MPKKYISVYISLLTRKGTPNKRTAAHAHFLRERKYTVNEIDEREVPLGYNDDGTPTQLVTMPTLLEVKCSELRAVGEIDITDPSSKKTLAIFKDAIRDKAMFAYKGNKVKLINKEGKVSVLPASHGCGHVDRVVKGLSALFAKAEKVTSSAPAQAAHDASALDD